MTFYYQKLFKYIYWFEVVELIRNHARGNMIWFIMIDHSFGIINRRWIKLRIIIHIQRIFTWLDHFDTSKKTKDVRIDLYYIFTSEVQWVICYTAVRIWFETCKSGDPFIFFCSLMITCRQACSEKVEIATVDSITLPLIHMCWWWCTSFVILPATVQECGVSKITLWT